MRLIVWMNCTANDIVGGPLTDPNTLVWADQDNIEDLSAKLLESMASVGTILLGRVTYEFFRTQWPLVDEWPDVSDVVLGLGEKINTTPKVVVSGHAIEGLNWGRFEPPTQLTGADVEDQIRQLKDGGGAIMTLGSPTLVQSLTNVGLVDEYDLAVFPVVMNEGRHLFEKLDARRDLRLLSAEALPQGAILVKYSVADLQADHRDPMG